MVTKVVMPRLSLTMKEGTVGKWYKKEGDVVEKNEPIVEIVSEKATYDLEAPASGVLRKIYLKGGVTAPVDSVIAVIVSPDEPFSETETHIESATLAETPERILASPAAKRLARESNVDLALIKGSGPEGRIAEEDVRKFLEQNESVLRVKQTIPLGSLRKTCAERVSISFRTAPHSTLFMEVNFSKATTLHRRHSVSYTSIIVDAAAKALIEHPMVNSTFEEDQIKLFEDVNIGVAMATGQGLVVPVIHNADKKTLQETDQLLKELSEKARAGKLAKAELISGTFTVTNLGMYGVDFFTPIINPPEAAILGVGSLIEKPIVVDGRIEIKPIVTMSLSYDHRTLDGAPAADFLRRIKEILEKTPTLEG